MWSPGSGGKLKVLKLEFVFVLAAEINQVSIAWIRSMVIC